MLPIRTILHPTDFSEQSTHALNMACRLAHDYGSRLVILHVAAQPIVVYGEGVLPTDPDLITQRAKEQLAQLVVPVAGVQAERRLVEGDVVTEILRESKQLPADLIVIGTHGRSRLERLLLGSVASEIVRKAPCPVLTTNGHSYESAPAPMPPARTARPAEGNGKKDIVQEASEESFPASDPPAW